MTPGIPFVVPFPILWGGLNKWNWGPPTPLPLKGGGDGAFCQGMLGLYSFLPAHGFSELNHQELFPSSRGADFATEFLLRAG